MSRTKNIQSRINYCQNQLEALREVDLTVQAPALGLSLTAEGKVGVNFLGREFLVDKTGVVAKDGRAVSVDNQSVVIHYLASRGRGDLTGEFVPISRLTGITVAVGSPSEKLTKPLIDRIGDNYQIFKETTGKLGGRYLGLSQAGAQSWQFDFLPKLPVRIDYFEADEEFPVDIKLLFDSSATIFVSYECLELLTMSLVVELLMVAGLITDPGDCESSFI